MTTEEKKRCIQKYEEYNGTGRERERFTLLEVMNYLGFNIFEDQENEFPKDHYNGTITAMVEEDDFLASIEREILL